MTDDEQADIRTFGDQSQARPMLVKDQQVGPIYVKSKGDIHPGYRGPVPARGQYGFVQFCERSKHYHRNEEAYMLSDKVLAHLRSQGVKIILIAEEDTGTVYEFHIRQFDEPVPQRAKGEREKDEDQTLVRVEENRGRFSDHAEYVLVGKREVN